MAEAPFAYLWQNAPFLEDGCFQFYPTAVRANAEIAYCGGWKTPVFASETDDTLGEIRSCVFDGLDKHQPRERLTVDTTRATAIRAYMETEHTGEYQAGHPSAGAARWSSPP